MLKKFSGNVEISVYFCVLYTFVSSVLTFMDSCSTLTLLGPLDLDSGEISNVDIQPFILHSPPKLFVSTFTTHIENRRKVSI